jgi:hypothetical protein
VVLDVNPERVVAAFFAVLCLAFLVRLMVGERRRALIDRTFWRVVQASKTPWRAVKRWRMRRDMAQKASKQAREAIARARITSVERQGNVYTPSAFNDKRQQNPASDKTQGPGPH